MIVQMSIQLYIVFWNRTAVLSLPAAILFSHLTLQLELSTVATLQGADNLSLSPGGLFDPERNNQAKGNRQVSCLAMLLKRHDIQCLQNEIRAPGQMLISSVNRWH